MRSVLPLAVVLLCVTLLFDATVALEHRTDGRTDARTVSIVAAAKGRLLAPAEFAEDAPLGSVIYVEDATLALDAFSLGLRVATLGADLSLEGHVSYDLARSPDDVDAFVLHVERAPRGTVLVLATTDDFRPRDPADAERVERIAEALGSAVRPFASMPASWAFLGVRGEHGWTKLAEAYSRDVGVLVSFTLEAGALPEDREGETLVIAHDTKELPLYLELDAAAERINTSFEFLASAGRDARRAIFAPVPRAPAAPGAPDYSLAAWDDVALDDAPVFHAGLALRAGSFPGSDGVVYSLVVDGEVAAERVLAAEDVPLDGGWLPWEVDLGAWAGRTVRFELRVGPNGTADLDRALWAEPVIRSRMR